MTKVDIRFNAAICKIEGLNSDIVEAIKSRLRVELTEERYQDYKNKTRLPLTKEGNNYYLIEEFDKHIHIPTGLLTKVYPYLKDQVKVDFNISKQIQPASVVRQPFLSLREEQQLAVNTFLTKKRGIIKAPTSWGKAQPLSAKVLTPSGWVTMGDLKVGDLITTAEGEISTVIATHPQGIKDIYEVLFTDGSKTECCKEHLWKVIDYVGRGDTKKYNKDYWKIKATEELIHTVIAPCKDKRLNYSIPLCSTIEFTYQEVPIAPYLLGALIGDGYLRETIVLTTPDKEIVERCSSELPNELYIKNCTYSKNIDYSILLKKVGKNKNTLVKHLKTLGLFKKLSTEKFIPKEYIYNTVEIRVAILQGLMDTDGYISQQGDIYFYTSSPYLASDFVELIRSLGGYARTSSKIPKYKHNGELKEGKLAYKIKFYLPDNIIPFHLNRKNERMKLGKRRLPKMIKSINYVGQKEAKCITIDSSSQLYITDDFIVTHNSRCIAELCRQFDNYTKILILVPTVLLLYQMQQDMADYISMGKQDIGLIGDGNFNINQITVAIPDTLAIKLQNLDSEVVSYLQSVNVVIGDEIHCHLTPTVFTIADYLVNTEYRFGLSATPILDNFSEGLIGTKLHEFAIKDSMKRGDIMTPEIIFHTVKDKVNLTPKLANFKFEQFEPKEMKIYNTLYDKVICTNHYRNSLAVEIVEQDLAEGRIVLVLVKKVATSGGVVNHAEIVQTELAAKGIYFDILHGKSKNKEQLKEDLANEKIKGLIASVGILSEGVSINSISSLVLLSAGSKDKDFVQRAGRALRKGNIQPKIHDFMDCQCCFINQSKARLTCAIEEYGKENVTVI